MIHWKNDTFLCLFGKSNFIFRKPFLFAANDSNSEINNIRTRHSTLSCEDKATNLLIDPSTTEVIFVIGCHDAREVTAILEVTLPNICLQ